MDSLNILLLSVTASIFAYGQTSSGKTYTMTGITECTVSDIYDYIGKVIKRLPFMRSQFWSEPVTVSLK
jgi:centromeric protein E